MKSHFKLLSKEYLLLLILFISINRTAQESISKQIEKPENKWNFLLDAYAMFPKMNGTTNSFDFTGS
ncbi:hypothetical protein [Flavobacterium pectinovorum]|uniref:Uncharacterized protein n=1 Tax=Flavobacterium pectinovorum TaxID=29533 RepID=A0A502EAR0_9FLAO|nr:hypothetical protein [Flavobacterium pectinovorum]TPG34805.1 hypothetical protein EAH81_22270 [Flavobacterium pectinovorum]